MSKRNVETISEKYLIQSMKRDLRIQINFIFLHIWFLIRFVWIPTINREGLKFGFSILNCCSMQSSDL